MKSTQFLCYIILFLSVLSCNKKQPLAITPTPQVDTADTTTTVPSPRIDPMAALLGTYEGWYKHIKYTANGQTFYEINDSSSSRVMIYRASEGVFGVTIQGLKNGQYTFAWEGGMYNYVEGETTYLGENTPGHPYITLAFSGDRVQYSFNYGWAQYNLGIYHGEEVHGAWQKVK